MNLDDLLNEMSEKIRNRDLSDEYLREHNNSTREEIGIGKYAYGITMIPCKWVYEYLSDYKRVLKENEELLEVKVSASAHNRILELEKENEELNKLHIQDNKHLNFIMKHSISIKKVEDKIEEIQEEGYWLFTTDRDSDKCVEVLQQLLEKEQ